MASGAWAPQVKRRIGPKRLAGTHEGLTKTQAEAEFRRLIRTVDEQAVATYRATVEEAGELVPA